MMDNTTRVRLKKLAILSGINPNLTDEELLKLEDRVSGPQNAVLAGVSEAELEAKVEAAVQAAYKQQADGLINANANALADLADVRSQAITEVERSVKNAQVDAQNTLIRIADLVSRAAFNASIEAELRLNKSFQDLTVQCKDQIGATSLLARGATENAIAATSAVTAELASIRSHIDQAVRSGFDEFKQSVAPEQVAAVLDTLDRPHIVRKDQTAKQVFGVDLRDADNAPVLVEVWNHPDAPQVDSDYVWNKEALRWALLLQDASQEDRPSIPPNLWLAGDRGTGKTQFASQFAARTGRSLVRVNFDRHLERLDFIGSTALTNGETAWKDGTFLIAFKREGTVILLDEFGFANPANVANLQALLEPASAVTYDGTTHRRAKGVLIFAADNSTGNADESGRYAGVQEQNSALLDRFPATMVFEYLPFAAESKLVAKKARVSKDLAEKIVKVFREARAKVSTGEVVDPPTLRQAFAVATAIRCGISFKSAWHTCVINKATAESRVTLVAIGESFWGPSNDPREGSSDSDEQS